MIPITIPGPVYVLVSPHGGYGDAPYVHECDPDRRAAFAAFAEYVFKEDGKVRAMRIDLDPETNLPVGTEDVTEDWLRQLAEDFDDADGFARLPAIFEAWLGDVDEYQPNYAAQRERERAGDARYDEWAETRGDAA